MKSLTRPMPRPLKQAAKHVLMRIRRHRYLLVLGHMRSGSTLLCHLLNTNPQVLGYGECHRTYRSARDLKGLVYAQSQYHRVSQ